MAFGLAAILDGTLPGPPDLNEGVRWQSVQTCLQMLGSEGRPGRDPEGSHVVA
ncbi:hypothetical protein [Pseudonocardia sp.]|uniref:hypothetical protein n=1 Tax=Pseudonocardia sp. TaxID=60912 RepID=UPI0031FBDD62